MGQPVGLRPSATDGLYEVFYCEQRIGWVDLRNAEPGTGVNLSLIRRLNE